MQAPPPGCDPDGIVLTFPVAREHAGQRLDRFIQGRIPRLSRTRAQEIVRSCAFRADGARRRASERVREGETVILVRPSFEEPETPRYFDVIYEDEAVLAVEKPAGLPMHPTATYHRNTLTYLLRETYGESPPQIAHRIDRETSGVIVCGKGIEAERALKIAFERREVAKVYLAIVEGVIEQDEGIVDTPMSAVDEGLHILMRTRAVGEGLAARTHYEVRERHADRSLVELHPETGRQHQLRVHLASIGHPIVGDKLYGADREAPFLEWIETGMTRTLLHRLGHERQALHAHQLEVSHPVSGEPLVLKSAFPPDLVDLWNKG